MLQRRTLLISTAALAAGAAPWVRAQSFPERAIHWIVPYAPGGTGDQVARLVSAAPTMKINGQSVIVDNRPGAGTIIGTQTIAAARADGYTIGQIDPQFAINASLRPELSYRQADFTYIAGIGTLPMALALRADFPGKTLKEVLDHIRTSGDKLSYGTWGVGSINHLAGEDLSERLGAPCVAAAYPGSAPIAQALIGKQIDFTFLDMPTLAPFAEAGRLRIVAMTSPSRMPSMPDVPALAEFFPGFEYLTFLGIAGPKGIPPERVKAVSEALLSTVGQADIRKNLEQRGITPWGVGPEELQAFVHKQSDLFRSIIQKRNIRVN